jgi:hypothetical protein
MSWKAPGARRVTCVNFLLLNSGYACLPLHPTDRPPFSTFGGAKRREQEHGKISEWLVAFLCGFAVDSCRKYYARRLESVEIHARVAAN